jgi:hypothetical protein
MIVSIFAQRHGGRSDDLKERHRGYHNGWVVGQIDVRFRSVVDA